MNKTDKYASLRIEVVWNREFNWSHWADDTSLNSAIGKARLLLNSGDGARVKKARIVDNDTEETLWPHRY